MLLAKAPISTFSNWRQYNLLRHFYDMIPVPNLCVYVLTLLLLLDGDGLLLGGLRLWLAVGRLQLG